MHTPLCKHAVGSIADYAEAAQLKGIGEIGISDHMPMPEPYDPLYRMILSEFPHYIEMVQQAQQDIDAISIRFGIEGDYEPNYIDFVRDFLPQYSFDFVIGSIHYINDWGFDNPQYMKEFDNRDLEDVYRTYFGLVTDMANTQLFDIAGHFDLVKKFGYIPAGGYLPLAEEALDAIKDTDMCIELNTAGLRKPCGEIYPSPEILQAMHDRDIPVTLGSDAHKPDEVGYGFPQALEQLRHIGYTAICRFQHRERISIPLEEVLIA